MIGYEAETKLGRRVNISGEYPGANASEAAAVDELMQAAAKVALSVGKVATPESEKALEKLAAVVRKNL